MEQIKKTNWIASCVALIVIFLVGCEGGTGDAGAPGSTGTTGVAGSTARMVIVDNYLYAIADNKIQLFDITTPSSPAPWNNVTVDWNIQTLFPYQNFLLVGAADGIHILDNTDPSSPMVVGDFRHATAIDPVVATGGYAYVTLKNDPDAGVRIDDQMNVINLADFRNPVLENTIAMQSPEGLSTVDQRLFVCDGIAGIKQFDLSDPVNPTIVDVVARVDCNDVIAHNGILYAITDTTLQQYDYNFSPPTLLSTIETTQMSPDALTDLISNQSSLTDVN